MAAPSPRARFEHLFGLYRANVVAYFKRRLASPDDALDAAADVFLIVWRRIDTVPTGSELPWIYGVCRRVLANHLRSGRRRERLRAKLGGLAVAGGLDPVDAIAGADELARVLRSIDRLSPGDREVLLLVAWEDLGPQDLAVVLGCTPHAASQRLYRAQRRLERLLIRSGHEEQVRPDDERETRV